LSAVAKWSENIQQSQNARPVSDGATKNLLIARLRENKKGI
jgi:hypothetical protein